VRLVFAQKTAVLGFDSNDSIHSNQITRRMATWLSEKDASAPSSSPKKNGEMRQRADTNSGKEHREQSAQATQSSLHLALCSPPLYRAGVETLTNFIALRERVCLATRKSRRSRTVQGI